MPKTVDFSGIFARPAARGGATRSFQHNGLSRLSGFVTLAITLVALALSASPAAAGQLVGNWGCKFSGYYGYSNCRTTWTEISDPVNDPEQERLDRIAREQENQKWEAFCKPTFKADQYGVRRATYAVRGCEYGRSE